MASPFEIQVTAIGGPEVLQSRSIEVPVPAPHQVVLVHTAIGVNFVDIYLRAGQAHSHNPQPPFVPGINAVGEIVALGSQVKDLQLGQKVTYTNAGVGSYSTHVAVSAERLIPVPPDVDDVRVAAGLVRALTCQYLLKQMRQLEPGTRVLVHAAAGGVGWGKFWSSGPNAWAWWCWPLQAAKPRSRPPWRWGQISPSITAARTLSPRSNASRRDRA